MSECPICLEEFKHDDALSKTECGHTFHSKCIFRAITVNINCPSCRTPMVQITSGTENVSQGPQEQTLEHDFNHIGLIRMINDRLLNDDSSGPHNIETNDEETDLNIPNFRQGLLNRMFSGLTHSNPIDLTNDVEEISGDITPQEILSHPPSNRPTDEEPSIEAVTRSYINNLSSDLEQLSGEIISFHRHPLLNRFNNNEIQHEFRFNRSVRRYLDHL